MLLYGLIFLLISATAVPYSRNFLPPSNGSVINSTNNLSLATETPVLTSSSAKVPIGMTIRTLARTTGWLATANATVPTSDATATRNGTTSSTTTTTSTAAVTDSSSISTNSSTGIPIRTSETPTTGQTVTATNLSNHASSPKLNVVSANSNETSTDLDYVVGYHRIADDKNEAGNSGLKTIMVVAVILLLVVVVAVLVGIGIWKRKKDVKAERVKADRNKETKKDPEEQVLIKSKRSQTKQFPAMSRTQSSTPSSGTPATKSMQCTIP